MAKSFSTSGLRAPRCGDRRRRNERNDCGLPHAQPRLPAAGKRATLGWQCLFDGVSGKRLCHRVSVFGENEYAYSFAKEIGLEPLPINDRDSTVIKGEWIASTWAEGLDKLPYPASVREGFKKFKKEMLAIDVEKRGSELYNVPFSDFMKGYPAEVKQWWDNYGPSNWGATTRRQPPHWASAKFRRSAETPFPISTLGPADWARLPRIG